MTPRRTGRSLAPTLAILVVLLGAGTEVAAQPGSPVYVDESPLAWEMLRRARAQTAENEGEAVRLYQELLDEYGQKLVPRNEAATDEYVDVRGMVLADLRAHEGLLRRYRLMQTAEAQRLLENDALPQTPITDDDASRIENIHQRGQDQPADGQ